MLRTTDSTYGKRCALNLRLDQPKPTQTNRLWSKTAFKVA